MNDLRTRPGLPFEQLTEAVLAAARDAYLPYTGKLSSARFKGRDTQTARVVGKEPRLPRWAELLTTALDVELVATKVSRALAELDKASRSDGTLFSYHFDAWLFQLAAYIDRCELLTIRAVRLMADQRGRDVVRTLHKRIATDKQVISRHRNPLAHDAGGGIDGVTERWPAFLATQPSVAGELSSLAATIVHSGLNAIDRAPVEKRLEWLGAVRGTTHQVMRYSDEWFNFANNAIVSR